MKIDDLNKLNLHPTSIEECWEVIGQLVAIIQQLQERLNTNSKNSSSPPSKDFKKSNKPEKPSSGRKPGGQPGHPGITRRLVPLEQVGEVIACLPPEMCADCAQPLIKVPKIIRHQVYELPEPRYIITEYQINHGQCSHCYKTYAGELPAVVGKRGFGPRVHALLSVLTTKFRQSKRQALRLVQDVYGMPLCVGSVSNIEGRVSQAVAPIHSQIHTKLATEPVLNVDETGFQQNAQNGWAWVVASPQWTYFYCALSRGKKVAKQLLKNFGDQIIVSDRYSAYNYLSESQHQVYWAHLKRDFTKMAERSGFAGVVGRRLLHSYGKIFAFWKALQAADF
jgi:transposase